MKYRSQRPRVLFTALLISLASITGHSTAATTSQAHTGLLQQAENAYRSGDLETALQTWVDAAAQAGVQQDSRGASQALARAAAAAQGLGQYQTAIEHLQQARKLVTQTGDRSDYADLTHRLGAAYLLLPDTDSAEPLLKDALQIARSRKDTALEAALADSLGNLEQLRGNASAAAEHYARGMALADRLGDSALQARSATNAGQLSLKAGDYAAANTLLARAHPAASKLLDSRDTTYLLIRIARLQQQLAAALPAQRAALVRAAYDGLQLAEQVAGRIGDARAQSWAWGYLGELYESQGRIDDARQLTRQAIYALQGLHAPELLFRWQWQQGRLLKAGDDTGKAIEVYRSAIKTLHGVRTELAASLERTRESYHRLVGPLYLEYADLLLQAGEAASDPAEVQRRLVEARDAVELLKTVELQDYFQDDCVSLARSRVQGLEETLSPQTAVIYPILFPDRTELLVSTGDGLARHTVNVTAADMTAEVRDFRRKLEKRTTRQYMRPARQLYDWLIRPLEQELAKRDIDTLVIVPDAALRTIPMAALHDGKQYLVHKYALASTPSLELTDPRPIRAQNIDLLLSGLTEAVQGFPALPNVATELETLQSMYSARVLEDDTFNSSSFQGALADHPYSVVHIASHGKFEGRVSDSFILTHDDRLTMDDLEQYIGLSQVRVDQPVELLTLSACQTAAGDDWAGLGLASIAIKAGARSALATLWYVNDRVTSDLVTTFYRNLGKPDTTKAAALQQAQLEILADLRYRHPAYWAPYLLIGNWL
jgi:CHAT domain-containing protein